MADTGSGGGPPAIIHCGESHLESIQAIYNYEILHTTALYEYEPRSHGVMAAWWAAKQTAGLPVLGVESEPGVLAGFATWGPFRPFPAYLHTAEHSVYVDAKFRGRRIGHALLVALIKAAESRDLHVLVGGIDAGNQASISLHRKLGFTHAGTIREAGLKFGGWLDLDFWQLCLSPRLHGGTPAQTRGSSKPLR